MRDLVSYTILAWLQNIAAAFPAPIKLTLLQLILGIASSTSGHISSILLDLNTDKHWTTYYKAVRKGRFSLKKIRIAWAALCIACRFKSLSSRIVIAVDDTLVFRSSKNAPDADSHYDHSHKNNTVDFPLSQSYVALFFISRRDEKPAAIPASLFLMQNKGNRSKLDVALNLTSRLKNQAQDRDFLLLTDSWFMKSTLLLPLIDIGVHCLGPIRKDSVLHLPPVRKAGRGRPRRYGQKLSLDFVQDHFLLNHVEVFAYGKTRHFELYCVDAQVRFLKGRISRIVYCRFQNDDGSKTPWQTLLSTDLSLGAAEIIRHHASRWAVEPAFNELKNTFGLKQAWQQSRKALIRWATFISIAHGLAALTSLIFSKDLAEISPIPWRKGKPMTAGWAARALGSIFRNVDLSSLASLTSKKTSTPEPSNDTSLNKIA